MKQITFDIQHRVRYYETDKMGYVHNSNYFRFFEIGREELWRSLGYSYDQMEKEEIMMPLVEQQARYHVPAVYDDLLTIRTTLKEIPQAKILYEYKVFSIKEGKEVLHANGWNTLCFVDANTRKPQRCPQWIKEIIQKILSE